MPKLTMNWISALKNTYNEPLIVLKSLNPDFSDLIFTIAHILNL